MLISAREQHEDGRRVTVARRSIYEGVMIGVLTLAHQSRDWNWRQPIIALGTVLLLASHVQATGQQRFKSPDEAANALIVAAKAEDLKQVLAILGPAGRDIISSGDKVADKNARAKFLSAYDAGNKISNEGADRATLVVGKAEWPFPIPLVQREGQWFFDAVAGRQEILFRRIGRNERATIQVCLAYVDAQNEYAQMDVQKTGLPVYAERLISHPGKKDGLYWPSKEGEQASPLGALAASAVREGYQMGGGGTPYYGYYYKILKRQGPAATGGAYDYVAHGKMIGGFSLVAYPAEYGNSGVMTFIVNHNGIVFEKDLGPSTSKTASEMVSFNPDGTTWKKVSPEDVAAEKAK